MLDHLNNLLGGLPPGLRDIAAQQAGALSRGQAIEGGVTRSQLAVAVERNRWQRVHPGVYVVFTGPVVGDARLWAALLWAGPGAALRDRTALAQLGVASIGAPAVVQIAVEHARRVRNRPGVDVRRRTGLSAVVHPSRRPATVRVEDAALHVAAERPGTDGLAVLADVCRERLTTPARLRNALADLPALPGRTSLVKVLDDITDGAHSYLELSYLRNVERAHGLPRMNRQVRDECDGGVWRDGEYPEFGIVHELDGRLGHEWARDLSADRRRDLVTAASGRVTLRHGYSDVVGQPCTTALLVSRVLCARGWTGMPRRCGDGCSVDTAGGSGNF